MRSDSAIYVAGHRGLVGAAICRALRRQGHTNLVTRDRRELDLRDQRAVEEFFAATRPQYVFLAAARVGGIRANLDHPAEFIRDNLLLQTLVIDAAQRYGVDKLLFLGSSCAYPRDAIQPMTEDCLLGGPLESSNEAYAVAKIAGMKMCQAYRRQFGFDAIVLMPTNLYGPEDNFDPQASHVVPGMIRRFDDAKESAAGGVTLWGSGTPRRELMYVDDLAEAALYFMQHYSAEQIVNVGTGSDVTIRELAQLIAAVVGFDGRIEFDAGQPDGVARKQLDVSRQQQLGWQPRTTLRQGLEQTYAWYRSNRLNARR